MFVIYTNISLVRFEVPCSRSRAYCHKPGANPGAVSATQKFLMGKAIKTLPDPGIGPRNSIVALATTRPTSQVKVNIIKI